MTLVMTFKSWCFFGPLALCQAIYAHDTPTPWKFSNSSLAQFRPHISNTGSWPCIILSTVHQSTANQPDPASSSPLLLLRTSPRYNLIGVIGPLSGRVWCFETKNHSCWLALKVIYVSHHRQSRTKLWLQIQKVRQPSSADYCAHCCSLEFIKWSVGSAAMSSWKACLVGIAADPTRWTSLTEKIFYHMGTLQWIICK